jgi:hypothetical protein
MKLFNLSTDPPKRGKNGIQGLPGDGHNPVGARKHPQNNPWGGGQRDSTSKKIFFLKSLLYSICPKSFYSLPIAKYCPHMPSNSIKCKDNLGKIIPCSEIPHTPCKIVPVESPGPPVVTLQAHGSDLAPVSTPRE